MLVEIQPTIFYDPVTLVIELSFRKGSSMQVSYALSQLVLPVESNTTFDVLVTFQATATPDAGPRATRRPLNLSLVIDRSGSMAGYALQQALGAAETLVEQLSPHDVLSIVVYDDQIDTILPPQPVTDKAAIRALLRKVRAGGTTNLSGGWLKGCEHVQTNQNPESIQRVLLLTDGQANVGVTDSNVLIKTARQKAEAGIITTTLGFGTSFNEDLLIGMAQASGGNFYFIQSPDDATEVFRIEMQSLTAIAAQNLMVTLAPVSGSEAQISHILSNYRWEKRDDGQLVITLSDVYEGEDKLLAFETNLAAPATTGIFGLFNLSYIYAAVAEGSIQSFTSETPLLISATVGTIEEAMSATPATQVIEQISKVRIARAKEVAIQQADQGDYAAAIQTLREVTGDLRQKGLHERFEIAEEIEQLEHFAQQIEQRQFDPTIRKEMRDQSYQARSRSRADLSLRGIASGSARSLDTTKTVDSGIELSCYREGGKLRMKVISDGYNQNFKVQFPRSIREEGIHYVVEELQLSADGTFYRAVGQIRRLVLPGQENLYTTSRSSSRSGAPQASKVSARTAADLETTDSVGTGVLVQCIKAGSKLRARVVSDGYNPDYNMRFPRDIREEGTLYVVDEVIEIASGGSYIACGKIRRFVQSS
jgi:Ca-activated chloride channel family protein